MSLCLYIFQILMLKGLRSHNKLVISMTIPEKDVATAVLSSFFSFLLCIHLVCYHVIGSSFESSIFYAVAECFLYNNTKQNKKKIKKIK